MSRYIVELASSAGLVAPQSGRRDLFAPIPGDSEAAWVRAEAALEEVLRVQDEAPVRHVHHARDFGIGYGNSSGYGTDRHYVSDWNPPRFSFR